jgi:hypothetical protein
MKNHEMLTIVSMVAVIMLTGCGPEAGLIEGGRYASPEIDLPLQKLDLQRLIDEAPDNSVVDIPLGRYVLSETLRIQGRRGLRIVFARGAQLRCTDVNATVISIAGCHDVEVSGVRARHVEPLAGYMCHGAVVRIDDSADVRIDNCELNGCGAVGVSAHNSIVRITNCHIHSNSFNAIYLDECQVDIIGNIIENNANTLQAHRCDQIVWSDNIVRNNGGYWIEPVQPGVRTTDGPDLRPVPETNH